MASNLRDKTVVITGASRGIGEAIAVRVAQDGACVALLGKTERPHPNLPGTLHTAADRVREAGGTPLVCRCDVRDDEMIAAAVARVVDAFGGIDILVNNASAIFLAGTSDTPMKRFVLMQQVNVRATFAMTRACLPYLERADNPHVLMLSPPLHLESRWLAPHVAYTISKYGMSMCVLGMSAEFRGRGVAVNALWPKTTIATAAVRNLLGGEPLVRRSRTPQIVADAAYQVLTRPARKCTGNFLIDEDVLHEAGINDFSIYAVDPGADLQPDLFL